MDSTSGVNYFSVVSEFVKMEDGTKVLFNVDTETDNAYLDNFNIKLITIYLKEKLLT